MRTTIRLIILICLPLSVFAQKRVDIFSLSGNYNFTEAPANSNQNYELGIMSNLNIPIVLKDSSIWYSSIDYQYFSTATESATFTSLNNFSLHGIVLRTGLIYKLNQGKYLHVLFAPRYMGDFNASFGKSVQLGAIVLYEHQKSNTYTYRFGVLYNNECFGTYIVPVFYMDWALTDKIKFNGLLPVYGRLYYQPTEKFSAGLHFIGLTTSHRIHDQGMENYYVDRRSIDIDLFSTINIWDNFFIEGRVGYSISKSYGLYAENDKISLGVPLYNFGDNRTQLNEDSDPSAFIHLKLLYSIPVN